MLGDVSHRPNDPRLKRNRYGMDRNFRTEPTFEELDYFDPRMFLLAQELSSPLLLNIITFPIITSDNDQIENFLHAIVRDQPFLSNKIN